MLEHGIIIYNYAVIELRVYSLAHKCSQIFVHPQPSGVSRKQLCICFCVLFQVRVGMSSPLVAITCRINIIFYSPLLGGCYDYDNTINLL